MPNLGNKGNKSRTGKSHKLNSKSTKKLVEDLDDVESVEDSVESETPETIATDKIAITPFSDGLVNKAFNADIIVNDATYYTSRYCLVKGFFSYMKGSLYVGTIDTRHSSVTNSRRGRLV